MAEQPDHQQKRHQQPSGGSSKMCSLLQQLSQDLLQHGPADMVGGGCDSSDCLLCTGQRQFCNQAIRLTACSWLGPRRISSATAVCTTCAPSRTNSSSKCSSSSQVAQRQCGSEGGRLPHQPGALQDQQHQQQHHEPPPPPKRHRSSPDLTNNSFISTVGLDTPGPLQPLHQQQQPQPPQQQQQQQQHEVPAGEAQDPLLEADGQHLSALHLQTPVCADRSSTLLLAGTKGWRWQPEFDLFEQPAPAAFAEVAQLQSAADAAGGHVCGGRYDRITGLDFSSDGQLLATGSVSKQVAMYSLAALSELAAWDNVPSRAACPAGAESCAAAQRCQRQQQQQWGLLAGSVPPPPVLCPVATVRLPGKVSSLAFSPDVHGMVTVGDYDGTITQVHVASGHYLNEVDAHAGRRICSIKHSPLQAHLALTTSDDGCAKLWTGRGLAACGGTLRVLGRPALCDGDLSSTRDTLLALAAADARVYLYDLRHLETPLAVLAGHRRPVSYVRFFGAAQLVSASIDGSLALWDLDPLLGHGGSPHVPLAALAATAGTHTHGMPAPRSSTSSASSSSSSSSAASTPALPLWPAGSSSSTPSSAASCTTTGTVQQHSLLPPQPRKVFQGHTNEKHFVGLAVDAAAGLLAVGSEAPEVVSYHTSWSSPLARFSMLQDTQHHQHQGHSLQHQLQQPAAQCWSAAVAAAAPPPRPVTQQPQEQHQHVPSVSAVAWQPSASAAAMHGGGCALLAAATSTGECRLLHLVQPPR